MELDEDDIPFQVTEERDGIRGGKHADEVPEVMFSYYHPFNHGQ